MLSRHWGRGVDKQLYPCSTSALEEVSGQRHASTPKSPQRDLGQLIGYWQLCRHFVFNINLFVEFIWTSEQTV